MKKSKKLNARKNFKAKVTKKVQDVYKDDFPKNDSLQNRRITTHSLPKVEADRLEKAKQYWANRDDIDQVTISVDWCRSLYQSEIGGFSYDGPKVHWNDCYVYNHSLSVDIEGRLTLKDFNRLSALTKFNDEEFAYNETLIDVLSHQKCDNMWFNQHGFESDHIGKARLFRSGPPEKRILNLQCWVTVPDYVVRMLNMSLDSYIDVRLHMERFSNVANSLETSEEIKIFQMFIFHNRPSGNTKHRLKKLAEQTDIDKTPFADSRINKSVH